MKFEVTTCDIQKGVQKEWIVVFEDWLEFSSESFYS